MLVRQDLIEIIEDALEIERGTIDDNSNVEWHEKWDSLGHLSILIKLDKRLDGRCSPISELSRAYSVEKLMEILEENSLLEQ